MDIRIYPYKTQNDTGSTSDDLHHYDSSSTSDAVHPCNNTSTSDAVHPYDNGSISDAVHPCNNTSISDAVHPYDNGSPCSSGSVAAPPSKSMAHRLLICAALAEGISHISNCGISEDIQATTDCLKALGAVIENGSGSVSGFDPFRSEAAILPCRESGSTLRFLMPICALSGNRMTLTGSRRLMERPLEVYDELFAENNITLEKTIHPLKKAADSTKDTKYTSKSKEKSTAFFAELNSKDTDSLTYNCKKASSPSAAFNSKASASVTNTCEKASAAVVEFGDKASASIAEFNSKAPNPVICSDRKGTESEGEVTVQGRLSSGSFVMKGNISSQFISGMLFALPLLEGDSVIRLIPPVESRPYIDMTIKALETFGVRVYWTDTARSRNPNNSGNCSDLNKSGDASEPNNSGTGDLHGVNESSGFSAPKNPDIFSSSGGFSIPKNPGAFNDSDPVNGFDNTSAFSSSVDCSAHNNSGTLNTFNKEVSEQFIYIPGGQKYHPCDVKVEGDWSGAAYLLALGAHVNGLNQESLQGDKVCVNYFRAIEEACPKLDISGCPDLGPVLMAYAALHQGCTLTGTRRLSMKESDRGLAMQTELAKFGISVEIAEDSITVHSGGCTSENTSSPGCIGRQATKNTSTSSSGHTTKNTSTNCIDGHSPESETASGSGVCASENNTPSCDRVHTIEKAAENYGRVHTTKNTATNSHYKHTEESKVTSGYDRSAAENAAERCCLRPPSEPLYGHNDHRIVMALAVLCAKTGGVIQGAEAVSKSFPDFFDKLSELAIRTEEV